MSALVPNGGAGVSGAGRRNKFPRSARLLRHADFEQVYKRGRRHFAAHMTVFYLPRTTPDGESNARVSKNDARNDARDEAGQAAEGGARVGFTVGKVLGGSVVRNRMKRRLREAVRLHGQIAAAVDVVINPKKSLLAAPFADLQKEIGRAFEVIEKSAGKMPVLKR